MTSFISLGCFHLERAFFIAVHARSSRSAVCLTIMSLLESFYRAVIYTGRNIYSRQHEQRIGVQGRSSINELTELINAKQVSNLSTEVLELGPSPVGVIRGFNLLNLKNLKNCSS